MMKHFFMVITLWVMSISSVQSSTISVDSVAMQNQKKAVTLQNQSSLGLTKNSMSDQVSKQGVYFRGISEPDSSNENYKNGFLCGTGGIGSARATGVNFEAEDCDASNISNALGFDISKGGTLQFFNNFMYWLRQKGLREQNLKINNPDLRGTALDQRMASEGWDTIGASCLLISANPVLQKIIAPDKKAASDEVKVIAQLWYNGNNMLQLWSQDVALIKKGSGFTIAVSTQEDTTGFFADDMQASVAKSETTITPSKSAKKTKKSKKDKNADVAGASDDTYIATVRKVMQPANRNKEAYENSVNSPRQIRIQTVR